MLFSTKGGRAEKSERIIKRSVLHPHDYENAETGHEYEPHGDPSSDEIGVAGQAVLTLRNALYGVIGIAAIAIVALSISDWQNAHKPAEVTTLLLTRTHVSILCATKDRTRSIACPRNQPQDTLTIDALSNLTKDQDSQYALVQYLMPVIVRGAFTNITPVADGDSLKDYLRPFLLPNSQAAQFFFNYYKTENPSSRDAVQSTEVDVQQIPPSVDGGRTYYVPWTTTAYNSSGKTSTINTAKVTVTFDGPHTPQNPFGFYIDGFSIVANPQNVDNLSSGNGVQ